MTGVRRAVAFHEDAIVIFHSPQSCSQVIREKDLNIFKNSILDYDIKNVPIIATNISSEDVIFGAHKKFEECLRYVITKYRPAYVIVGNSCVAGIIGDDVINIGAKIGKESGVPVFISPCFGFMNGGYEEGLLSITKQLIEFYVKPSEKELAEVTLIGIIDKNRNYEYHFIESILSAWQLRINCIFPGAGRVAEMQKIGGSKACIFVVNIIWLITHIKK